jgi:hypothetical protein
MHSKPPLWSPSTHPQRQSSSSTHQQPCPHIRSMPDQV